MCISTSGHYRCALCCSANAKFVFSEFYLKTTKMKFPISTYTLSMNWMCSKDEPSKHRGLGCEVQHPSLVIICKPPSQYSKHIDHKCRYGSMEDNVQHMKANRVQASSQEVVQPKKEKKTCGELNITI